MYVSTNRRRDRHALSHTMARRGMAGISFQQLQSDTPAVVSATLAAMPSLTAYKESRTVLFRQVWQLSIEPHGDFHFLSHSLCWHRVYTVQTLSSFLWQLN